MKVLLGALLLAAACAGVALTEMHVDIGPPTYNPAVPSTIGIGLTPASHVQRGTKVRYHWTADYGYFLHFSEFTHEITHRGAETLTETGGKLFWSCDANDPATVARKPVRVIVLAEDKADGKVLARTDVHLVWDGDVVHIVR